MAPKAASQSPPPLPNEPLPTGPIDQPIESLGEGSDEEEEEVDTEDSKPSTSVDKGKGKAVVEKSEDLTESTEASKATEAENEGDVQPWQAVWAAEQNAWYFWNSTTGEVTWTNPLQPPSTSDTPTAEPSSSTSTAPIAPFSTSQPPLPMHEIPLPSRKFGVLPDIDPSLAYLLPTSQRGLADPTGQTAMFNSRTGRFTANDYTYTVDHLDEWNRAKRMSSKYFDVEAWERERAAEHAKRKREEEMGIVQNKQITKKDMDRFKKKKAEQRARNQAWLRD